MRAAAVAGDHDADEVSGAVREQPAMAGAALVAQVSTKEPYTFSDCGRSPSRGRRLRLQALDPAPARGERRRGRRVPARRRRGHARGYDGVAPLAGAGRPGAARRRDADAAGPARAHAGARRVPRSPAARARDRQGDVQAAVRASRREPSRARPPHAQGARHLAEPRLRGRGRRRIAASRTARSTTARSRGSTTPSCARARRSSTRRRRPGPHDAASIIGGFVEELKAADAADAPTSSRSA